MFYIYRWLVGWATLIDSLAQVATFGFWQPTWGLKAMSAWLDWQTPSN